MIYNPNKIYNFENALRFQGYESFLIGFPLLQNYFAFPRRLFKEDFRQEFK